MAIAHGIVCVREHESFVGAQVEAVAIWSRSSTPALSGSPKRHHKDVSKRTLDALCGFFTYYFYNQDDLVLCFRNVSL